MNFNGIKRYFSNSSLYSLLLILFDDEAEAVDEDVFSWIIFIKFPMSTSFVVDEGARWYCS